MRELHCDNVIQAWLSEAVISVISQRTCVQELELELVIYSLFRGPKLSGFEHSLICDRRESTNQNPKHDGAPPGRGG